MLTVIDLERLYDSIPTDTRIAGREWYLLARHEINEIALAQQCPRPIVAAIVSALSPQLRWSMNIINAERLITALYRGDTVAPRGLTTYQFNADKAWRILTNDLPLESAFRDNTKTRNFYLNLIGDENAVTIDTWMTRALDLPYKSLSPKRYRQVASLVGTAAQLVNEVPAQFQAMIWLHTKDVNNGSLSDSGVFGTDH